MEPTLVLFDVDGTLIDSAGAGRDAVHAALRRVFGLDGELLASTRVKFAGMTDPNIFRSLALAAGVPEDLYDRRRGRLFDEYVDRLRDEMARHVPRRRVLPGVVPLLEALGRRQGVHLGLLTGNLEDGARIKLAPFDLNRFFTTGGFASDDADRRTIARIAVSRLCRQAAARVPRSRVVVVGDTEHDVDCARANGYRSLAVCTGFASRRRLQHSKPDALFEDLTDLPAVLAEIT